MNRREKIRDKALELFNERGIEYVGLREIAAVLEMRVSNITYYFPTKDDLVYELSQELSKANSEIMQLGEEDGLIDFLEMLHRIFQNHVQFRGLLLSFVHVMEQNKRVAAAYKKTQTARSHTLLENLQLLVSSGFLKMNETEIQDLTGVLSIINRFWISEAAIAQKQSTPKQQIFHYLKIIIRLLMPYATAKGKRDVEVFLEKWER